MFFPLGNAESEAIHLFYTGNDPNVLLSQSCYVSRAERYSSCVAERSAVDELLLLWAAMAELAEQRGRGGKLPNGMETL